MEAWHLLVYAVVVLVVVLVVRSRALAVRPRREKVGYAVGVVVYLVLHVLLRSLGDDRDLPWQIAVAVLAVAVAVDLLLQVPRVRPAPKQVAIAFVGWGVGAVLMTPIVVAVYVARRVMNLPVIRKVPGHPVSSARSPGRSGADDAASGAVGRPKND